MDEFFLLYLVLKGQKAGGWLQYKSIFTNMNIFSSMMSVEDLIQRTIQSGDSCYSPGDYLRLALIAYKQYKDMLVSRIFLHLYSWEEMEWNIAGDVKVGTVVTEDLCSR